MTPHPSTREMAMILGYSDGRKVRAIESAEDLASHTEVSGPASAILVLLEAYPDLAQVMLAQAQAGREHVTPERARAIRHSIRLRREDK